MSDWSEEEYNSMLGLIPGDSLPEKNSNTFKV
jgi:hypothetical protein